MTAPGLWLFSYGKENYYGADSTHRHIYCGVSDCGDILPAYQLPEIYGQAERGDCPLDGVLAGHGKGIQEALRPGVRPFLLGLYFSASP